MLFLAFLLEKPSRKIVLVSLITFVLSVGPPIACPGLRMEGLADGTLKVTYVSERPCPSGEGKNHDLCRDRVGVDSGSILVTKGASQSPGPVQRKRLHRDGADTKVRLHRRALRNGKTAVSWRSFRERYFQDQHRSPEAGGFPSGLFVQISTSTRARRIHLKVDPVPREPVVHVLEGKVQIKKTADPAKIPWSGREKRRSFRAKKRLTRARSFKPNLIAHFMDRKNFVAVVTGRGCGRGKPEEQTASNFLLKLFKPESGWTARK